MQISVGGLLVSPSKLHAYLALALPIIYVGPVGSNVDEAVTTHEIGFSLRPEDDRGVAIAVKALLETPGLMTAMRRNARLAFEAAYCDEKAIPLLEHALTTVVSREVARDQCRV